MLSSGRVVSQWITHTGSCEDLVGQCRVPPGTSVSMGRDFDPAGGDGTSSRSEGQARLEEVIQVIDDYQDRLSAAANRGILLVIQALDAGGKDSTIKHVMRGLNPQGVEVHSFKEPTDEELRHDFLWRCQRVAPERGRIGIFNRSHYEDVLVVRVHSELLRRQGGSDRAGTTRIWARRFQEINDWERHLVANDIAVVKVLLNVSKAEQARRFIDRIDRPEKNWKFAPGDIHERRYWDDYQRAFGEMLSHTSTRVGPVACGARRPEVVRSVGHRRHPGPDAHRHRPAVPEGGRVGPPADGDGPGGAGCRASRLIGALGSLL